MNRLYDKWLLTATFVLATKLYSVLVIIPPKRLCISRHCVRPPYCIQMCLHGLKPASGLQWSFEAKRFFDREMRDDVPVAVSIVGRGRSTGLVVYLSI